MNEYARAVKTFATQIQEETGQPNLILIGHSMGGIISSMVAMEEPDAICSVITIGSPMNGTHLAKLGLGQNAREMERESQCLLHLNEQLKAKTNTQFYHMGTKTDQIVIPAHSALRGSCPENEFLFEDLGHASLLFSPRVADVLVHWLKKAIPLATDSEGLRCKEGSKSL
jgi:triacylglycerol esterase/lipase EstA (alpha/beta hydrolase family)